MEQLDHHDLLAVALEMSRELDEASAFERMARKRIQELEVEVSKLARDLDDLRLLRSLARALPPDPA